MLSKAWRRGVHRAVLLQGRRTASAQSRVLLHASALQRNVATEQVPPIAGEEPELVQRVHEKKLRETPPIPAEDQPPSASSSSNTHSGKSSQQRQKRLSRHDYSPVTTLDPARLTSADVLDLSGLRFTGITLFRDPNQPVGSREKYRVPLTYNLWPLASTADLKPFPPGTRGFFYFHHNPFHPSVSGVRFRIVHSGDPADFATGHDLQAPDGLAWGPRLYRLVAPFRPQSSRGYRKPAEEIRNAYYREKRGTPEVRLRKSRKHARQAELLDYLRDYHVSEEDLSTARRLEATSPSGYFHSRQQYTVESLSDPFTLQLGMSRSIRLVTPEGIHTLRVQGVSTIGQKAVWEGLIRARFELSTLNEHMNTRTVVIRILDVLDGPRLVWPGASGGIPYLDDAEPDLSPSHPVEPINRVRKQIGVWAPAPPSSTDDRGWTELDILHLPRTGHRDPQMTDALSEIERVEAYIDHESGKQMPGRPANTRPFVFTPVPKAGALLPNPRWPVKVWSVNVDNSLPSSLALRPLVDLDFAMKQRGS